jgi:acetoin utilization protein AcuB
MRTELVTDWMTSEPITVTPETGLMDAHALLSGHNIRRLPVVRRGGKLVGIVTLGDVREASPSDATSLSIWELNYLLAKLTVADIMTPKPITVSASDTIAKAARLMLEQKVSGLPVVETDGTLVGIITESDIFRLVVRNWGEFETTEVEYAR